MEAGIWFGIYMGLVGLVAGLIVGFIGTRNREHRAYHKGKAEGWFEASEFMGPPLDVRKVYQRSLSDLRRVK